MAILCVQYVVLIFMTNFDKFVQEALERVSVVDTICLFVRCYIVIRGCETKHIMTSFYQAEAKSVDKEGVKGDKEGDKGDKEGDKGDKEGDKGDNEGVKGDKEEAVGGEENASASQSKSGDDEANGN